MQSCKILGFLNFFLTDRLTLTSSRGAFAPKNVNFQGIICKLAPKVDLEINISVFFTFTFFKVWDLGDNCRALTNHT